MQNLVEAWVKAENEAYWLKHHTNDMYAAFRKHVEAGELHKQVLEMSEHWYWSGYGDGYGVDGI